MSFLAENWILILIAVVSGSLLVHAHLQGSTGSGQVDANEAVRLINREKAVLVDVSEPKEYADGHAAGARNIPFGQCEAGHAQLPSNKSLPVVLLCPTGARAGKAASILRKAGYEKAVAVAGGTKAWREASLPVEKAA